MKSILRHYVFDTFSLFVVSAAVSGIVFEKGIETLLLAGLGLSLASILAKPVINILLLPINLITFGFFRWVSSAIALFLVTLIVPGFRIEGFLYQGFSTQWVEIPAITLGGVMAIVAFSFLLSITVSILHWIRK